MLNGDCKQEWFQKDDRDEERDLHDPMSEEASDLSRVSPHQDGSKGGATETVGGSRAVSRPPGLTRGHLREDGCSIWTWGREACRELRVFPPGIGEATGAAATGSDCVP